MIRSRPAVGSDLAETDRLVRRPRRGVTAPRPDVLRVFAVAGGFGGGGVNTGIYVRHPCAAEERETRRPRSAEVRKELNSYPGQRAVVQDLSQQGFTAQRGFPVEFSVRGSDWDQLIGSASSCSEPTSGNRALVVDLDSDYQLGMPELRGAARPRSRRRSRASPMDEVATSLNALVGGVRVGKYSAGGRRIRRPPAPARRSAVAAPRISLTCGSRASSGELVPLVGAGHRPKSARRCRRSPAGIASAPSPSSPTSRRATPRTRRSPRWRSSARAARSAIARCWAAPAWPSASPCPADLRADLGDHRWRT
jgi:multidrug efflux pump